MNTLNDKFLKRLILDINQDKKLINFTKIVMSKIRLWHKRRLLAVIISFMIGFSFWNYGILMFFILKLSYQLWFPEVLEILKWVYKFI